MKIETDEDGMDATMDAVCDKRISDAIDIKVIIKDDDQKLVKKFLSYSAFTISHDDPDLCKMVEESIQDFKGEAMQSDIKVQVTYVW